MHFLASQSGFEQLDDATQSIIMKLSETDQTRDQSLRSLISVLEAAESQTQQKVVEKIDVYHGELNRSHRFLQTLVEDLSRDFLDFRKRHTDAAAKAMAIVSNLELAATKVEDNILERLRFPEIDYRFNEISDACQQTFQWVLKDSDTIEPAWDNFASWLRQGDGLYWIQGKAASGKSTLIKYIWNNSLTSEILDTWSGSKGLIQAIFFMWSGGAPAQRTQEGLLRTMLHSVLKHQRMMISDVFPEEWSRKSAQLGYKSRLAQEKWCLRGLQTAFEKLISLADDRLKMCFFIDGLDEYEGDAEELAEYILRLSLSSPNVKFCVSSRPWPVFLDVMYGRPRLKLQDLNREDIQVCVHRNLHSNRLFRELMRRDPESANDLTKEVVEKSAGVFLWVVLVVRSLISGLRNGDQILHLRERLAGLPAELEHLFENLWKKVERNNKEEASMMFQIFRASGQRLDILTLYRALSTQSLDVVFSLPLDENDSDTDSNDRRLTRMKAEMENFWLRVNSRTMGLLEAPSPTWDREDQSRSWWQPNDPLFIHDSFQFLQFQRISYIHRTAKDYLEHEDVWTKILAEVEDRCFNPYTALLMALVIEAKTVVPRLPIQQFCDGARQLFQKASRLEAAGSIPELRLMSHLDDILTKCASLLGPTHHTRGPVSHWCDLDPWAIYTKEQVYNTLSPGWYLASLQRDYLCLGYCGVRKADHTCGGPIGPIPTIGYALGLDRCHRFATTPPVPNLEAAQCFLMRNSVRPNDRFIDSTIWSQVLSRIHLLHQDTEDWAERHIWLKVCVLMLPEVNTGRSITLPVPFSPNHLKRQASVRPRKVANKTEERITQQWL